MLKRLALISFGFLVFVVALEVLLQVGALVVWATGRASPGAFTSGSLRVLCVGDSHTYGLWVDRDEAYPQQVERIWNERHDAPRLEVLNLGYPGTNSSWLLREFSRMLQTLKPDLVIVMVGANDFWTMPVPAASPDQLPPEPSFIARHSRVLKLFLIWRSSLEDRRGDEPRLEVELDPHRSWKSERGTIRYGDEEFELGFVQREEIQPDSWRRASAAIAPNVQRMIELAEEAGAWTLVLQYPSPRMPFPWARPGLQRAAAATGAGLLDLAPLFATRCPSRRPPIGEDWCPKFMDVTDHAKANGYLIIAEAVVDVLEPQLLR